MPKMNVMKKPCFLGFGLSLGVGMLALAPSAMAQPAGSMAQIVDARILQICQSIGLEPGTLGFRYCRISLEVSADEAVQARSTLATSGPVAIKGLPSGREDFYRSPPREQGARVATACQEMGLDPQSGVLQRCISSLNAMLWQAAMPN
ncbi:MAG TPA: hypothetical protein VL492_11770 [Methylovirgula sp.]|jgi:hypothetical protein|nr:hypothetical protein [Methylovirgula sp.]